MFCTTVINLIWNLWPEWVSRHVDMSTRTPTIMNVLCFSPYGLNWTQKLDGCLRANNFMFARRNPLVYICWLNQIFLTNIFPIKICFVLLLLHTKFRKSGISIYNISNNGLVFIFNVFKQPFWFSRDERTIRS